MQMMTTKYGKNGRSVKSIVKELEDRITVLEQNKDEAIKLADSWIETTYAAEAGRALARQFRNILTGTNV